MKRVMTAMSGGVDSSVAAYILAQGENLLLEGAYIRTWQHEENYTMLVPALLCLVLGAVVVVLLQVLFATKPSESAN